MREGERARFLLFALLCSRVRERGREPPICLPPLLLSLEFVPLFSSWGDLRNLLIFMLDKLGKLLTDFWSPRTGKYPADYDHIKIDIKNKLYFCEKI